MEEQIPLRPDIAPRFIGHGPEDERPQPVGRLPMADVDDATVVYFIVAGSVGVQPPVKPATHRQREVPSREDETAIMLPKPFALPPQLDVVSIGPEAVQKGGASLSCLPVELSQ